MRLHGCCWPELAHAQESSCSAARVADYKLPDALMVMNDFPMSPAGKIRRPELVKRVAGVV